MKSNIKRYLGTIFVFIFCILTIIIIKNNMIQIISSYNFMKINNIKPIFTIFSKSITNDTFFSIPLGKRIYEEGFKNNDILTWHNINFSNDRWLFNLIIFDVYNKFGIDGIVNFTTLFTIIIGVTLYLCTRWKTQNNLLSVIVTLFAMYFSRSVFLARAQIISFWFFIIEFYFLEKLIETNKKKYSIFLIIIAIFIANIHASVYPICFVFYLPYFVQYFVDKYSFINNDVKLALIDNVEIKKFSEINSIKLVFISFFGTLLAGVFTPLKDIPYTVLIRAILYTDTSFIGECQPSTFFNNRPLFILLGISIFMFFIPRVKIELRYICFILGLGLMGILVYRGTYFYYLIGSIIIAIQIQKIIEIYNLKIEKRELKIIFNISIFLILGTLYLRQYMFIQRDEVISEVYYPVKLSDYIINNLDIDNIRIFNSFNFGSYLEFKGIKAFIDSRSEVFTEEFNSGCTVLNDWVEVYNNPSKCFDIFEKYKITHVVDSVNSDICMQLEKDEKWKRIYLDKNFALYERI